MNKEEYGKIIDLQFKDIPPIQAEDLKDTTDRTLLYGYTCDRDTFHVYIKDMKIHVVTYRTDYENNAPDSMKEISVDSNDDYLPNKRLYPEGCDYEFCEKLKKLRYDLPFTTWNSDRPVAQFYGFTLEDRKCCGNCGVTEDSYCNECGNHNKWIRRKQEIKKMKTIWYAVVKPIDVPEDMNDREIDDKINEIADGKDVIWSYHEDLFSQW